MAARGYRNWQTFQKFGNSWALGSVEILLSRHCPIWYGYSGRIKWLERLAYINTTVYPITSIPLVAYCTLPAIYLLTGKFIIPEISTLASLWFISLFLSIFATGILEMRWSGVGIDEWWRNEQFWVIGGVFAHFFCSHSRIAEGPCWCWHELHCYIKSFRWRWWGVCNSVLIFRQKAQNFCLEGMWNSNLSLVGQQRYFIQHGI